MRAQRSLFFIAVFSNLSACKLMNNSTETKTFTDEKSGFEIVDIPVTSGQGFTLLREAADQKPSFLDKHPSPLAIAVNNKNNYVCYVSLKGSENANKNSVINHNFTEVPVSIGEFFQALYDGTSSAALKNALEDADATFLANFKNAVVAASQVQNPSQSGTSLGLVAAPNVAGATAGFQKAFGESKARAAFVNFFRNSPMGKKVADIMADIQNREVHLALAKVAGQDSAKTIHFGKSVVSTVKTKAGSVTPKAILEKFQGVWDAVKSRAAADIEKTKSAVLNGRKTVSQGTEKVAQKAIEDTKTLTENIPQTGKDWKNAGVTLATTAGASAILTGTLFVTMGDWAYEKGGQTRQWLDRTVAQNQDAKNQPVADISDESALNAVNDAAQIMNSESFKTESSVTIQESVQKSKNLLDFTLGTADMNEVKRVMRNIGSAKASKFGAQSPNCRDIEEVKLQSIALVQSRK